MFNKIKSKLNSVFSKTQDVVEEEKEKQENLEESIHEEVNKDTYTDSKETSSEIENLEYEKSRVDELEQELEKELDETSNDVETLDHADSEKFESKKNADDIEAIDYETKEVNRLEEKLESEIDDVNHGVEELEHSDKLGGNSYIEEKDDKENFDEKSEKEEGAETDSTSKKSANLFSKLFKKKEVTQESEESLQKQTPSNDDLKHSSSHSSFSDEYEKSQPATSLKEEGSFDELNEEGDSTSKAGFLQSAFSGITQKKLNENDFNILWAELELFLLEINIAYEIVEKIEKKMHFALIGEKFSRISLKQKVKEVLIAEVSSVMKSKESHFDTIINEFLQEKKPVVIMMLGVNGTGKTTSIGKVIRHFQNQDKSVVVAAADTFRAAAVEQIQEHCDNLGVKCVKHKQGSDPAAVCYDAIEHAKAKDLDVVLIDTAGRMPNNSNLMNELKKIKRVSHTDMVLFVGDSVSGNDLIDQIELFNEGLGIDGVILTKVDTDERPGSVVTTAYSIDSSIYFLGTGQTYEDLVVFDSKFVAEQLFNEED